jgi:chromosomal replication initiation ATPase DnaA
MLGSGLTKEIVLPRQVAMHLMGKIYETGNRRVADMFKRDHTCVLLADKKIPKLADASPSFGRRLLTIETAIRAAA